jgi:large subunit ribosomal protein L22
MDTNNKNVEICGHATLSNVFLSSRKVNDVLSLIRGRDIRSATIALHRCPRVAATYISKLLNSAVANSGPRDELYILEATVGRGSAVKRVEFRGRGKTGMRTKFMCCMRIVLGVNL